MAQRFQNYRTAKKGEGRCIQCVNCYPPNWYQTQHRCGSDIGQYETSYAVGKTKTCDAFRQKPNPKESEEA